MAAHTCKKMCEDLGVQILSQIATKRVRESERKMPSIREGLRSLSVTVLEGAIFEAVSDPAPRDPYG